MARHAGTAHREWGRGWDHGPWGAPWGARRGGWPLLPLIGGAVLALLLANVAARLLFGFGFVGPWLFLPFVFLWIFTCRGDRHGRDRWHRREDERRPGGAGGPEWIAAESPVAPGAGATSPAALTREHRLEAELVETRRQIRELEAQLRWQADLLRSSPPPPPAPPLA